MERPASDFDEDHYRQQLSTLSGADFLGRRPGTDGEARTVAYLSEQFRRMKLKPLSGDSYLQSVPMIEFMPDGTPTLRVTGRGATHSLAFREQMLIWSRREQPLASLAGSEPLFAGFGIVAPELGRDDYGTLDVRGKTVLVLGGEPPDSVRPGGAGRGHLPGYYGRAELQD